MRPLALALLVLGAGPTACADGQPSRHAAFLGPGCAVPTMRDSGDYRLLFFVCPGEHSIRVPDSVMVDLALANQFHEPLTIHDGGWWGRTRAEVYGPDGDERTRAWIYMEISQHRTAPRVLMPGEVLSRRVNLACIGPLAPRLNPGAAPIRPPLCSREIDFSEPGDYRVVLKYDNSCDTPGCREGEWPMSQTVTLTLRSRGGDTPRPSVTGALDSFNKPAP